MNCMVMPQPVDRPIGFTRIHAAGMPYLPRANQAAKITARGLILGFMTRISGLNARADDASGWTFNLGVNRVASRSLIGSFSPFAADDAPHVNTWIDPPCSQRANPDFEVDLLAQKQGHAHTWRCSGCDLSSLFHSLKNVGEVLWHLALSCHQRPSPCRVRHARPARGGVAALAYHLPDGTGQPLMLATLALATCAVASPAASQTPPAQTQPPIDTTAATGERATENAVRSADDAFGTSIGRETIGLYNGNDVRGFSPTAAGNVRIDGLYFDQVWGLNPRLRRTTSIRVGLSALGSPFPAPTGIVDYAFRTPGDKTAVSALGALNQWGNSAFEVDANLPLDKKLSLGLGGAVFDDRFYNGTRAGFWQLSATARYAPSATLEIVPFVARSEGFDQTGPIFLPAGEALPPRLPRRFFAGPDWARYRGVAFNTGALVRWQIGDGWELRGGLFRSLFDDARSFANLITDIMPDGTGNQLIIADPPQKFASTSGEVRLTRTIADGPRAHRIHASVRARAGDRRFGGSDVIDLGPTSIFARTTAPIPSFSFTAQQEDRVRQWTAGVAYEGRWPGVGELSAGVQKTQYRKRIGLPGAVPVGTDAAPFLFNVTLAVRIGARLVAYGGYVTGLEESGIAPTNAANRNEALPAIRTSQRDAGLRYAITDEVKFVAGVFDVRKPYFNLDAKGRFDALGDVINQGIEASLAGPVTSRISIVAGAVLLRPRVTGEGVTLGRVGARPVGAISRRLELNADWRPSWIDGLSFDVSASHRSAESATVSNATVIPPRTLVDLGARYSFKLAGQPATLRLQVENLTDLQGFELRGAGAFDLIAGRRLGGYLTVDF